MIPSGAAKHDCVRSVGASIVVGLLLAGCNVLGGVRALNAEPPPPSRCVVEFFADYAALAADVYRTRGAEVERIQVYAEPVLRSLMKDDKGQSSLNLDKHKVEALYRRARTSCTETAARTALNSGGGQDPDPRSLCGLDTQQRLSADVLKEIANEGDDEFIDALAQCSQQCVERSGQRPKVPVSQLWSDGGWERVPQIDKYSITRSWRVFVPDLAIEVWRRKRPDTGYVDQVEYAVVFRGTTGSGGWVSNFRVLTAISPFFWDQYRQAERSARRIVEQIYVVDLLYQESQRQAQEAIGVQYTYRPPPFITAVGHSLGAGLAKHVYLNVKEFTRVVGFNPSPVDGSSTQIKVGERREVMAARRLDTVSKSACAELTGQSIPHASMFFMYEHGEVLSLVDGCHPGPLWGAEGGPVSICQSVEFSQGNIFRQHSMSTLACHLARHHYPPNLIAESTGAKPDPRIASCPPSTSNITADTQ